MGVLPNPFQQTFEVAVGAQTVSVDFQGAAREINWLEISLEYDSLTHTKQFTTVTV